MKVSDIMQKSVIKVSIDDPLKDVARIIFSLGISGVPVVDERKLVGIVTEEDIFRQIHPSFKDIVEDYTHSTSFIEMEKNISAILETPVKKLMNKSVHTISQDTPIMRAQTLMLLNHFSRLPVVNNRDELVGIISQGDIFREIMKNEMPQIEKERYAGFIARHYDLMVNWDKRFSYELPALFNEFRTHKMNSILDLGSWTGEYSVKLVKEGVSKIIGVDHNQSMVKTAQEKVKKLPRDLAKNIKFVLSDFTDLEKHVHGKFDGAICLGNSLPYIPIQAKDLFKSVAKVLNKNGTLILQILNLDKVLKENGRLLSFAIQKSNLASEKEHMFIEFFDKSDEDGKLLHHVVIFDNDGKNWIFKGITTIPIFYYSKNDIESALKHAGFTQVKFSGNRGEYQGEYGNLSFTDEFEPEKSDWMNIVAVK